MSKPLTTFERRVLDQCEPDSPVAIVALVAALDRLEFLERKMAVAQAVVDAARGVIKGADPAYGLIDALAEWDAMNE